MISHKRLRAINGKNKDCRHLNFWVVGYLKIKALLPVCVSRCVFRDLSRGKTRKHSVQWMALGLRAPWSLRAWIWSALGLPLFSRSSYMLVTSRDSLTEFCRKLLSSEYDESDAISRLLSKVTSLFHCPTFSTVHFLGHYASICRLFQLHEATTPLANAAFWDILGLILSL